MPVIIECSCGKRLGLPDGSPARQARCRACGKIHEVPTDPTPVVGDPVALDPPVAQSQASLPVVFLVGALLWAVVSSVILAVRLLEIHKVKAQTEATVLASANDRAALEQRARSEIAAASKERDQAFAETQRARSVASESTSAAARDATQLAHIQTEIADIQKDLRKPVKHRAILENEARAFVSREQSGPGLHVGGKVTLWSTASHVFVVTDDGWDDFRNAESLKDKKQLAVLIAARKVFLIRVGTRAKVTKTGYTTVKVQVLGGVDAGAEGWIYHDHADPES